MHQTHGLTTRAEDFDEYERSHQHGGWQASHLAASLHPFTKTELTRTQCVFMHKVRIHDKVITYSRQSTYFQVLMLRFYAAQSTYSRQALHSPGGRLMYLNMKLLR